MSELYDFRTVSFVAGTAPVVVTATVPDVMVGVISYAKYVSGAVGSTIYARLMQRRAGTITGTLDVAVLTPANPVYPTTGHGRPDSVVAIVSPGHEVVAQAEAGSVIGVITYAYLPGRFRR